MEKLQNINDCSNGYHDYEMFYGSSYAVPFPSNVHGVDPIPSNLDSP